MAAGKSTRMKSRLPKAVHRMCGRPMARHIIESCREAGVERIVVVIGHEADAVREALGSDVEYAVQTEQLGTGHAVRSAGHLLADHSGPLAVLPADTPLIRPESLAAIMQRCSQNGAAATLLTARLDEPAAYGRVVRDDSGQVVRITEAKDAPPGILAIDEICTSIYAFNAGDLFPALEQLSPENRQKEYYLTDVVAILAAQGRRVDAIVSDDYRECLGINTRVELAEATAILRHRIVRAHMLAGVTMIDPAAVYIDVDVEIGADTVLYPGVIIEGRTRIGGDCEIGPNSRIVASDIGEGVRIDNSCVVESTIGPNSSVGPYSRLRPGSRIGCDVRIGDFVEIKNSTVGDGVSLAHMTYIGDAEIGEGTNVGAGTITCNYDGKRKHRTTIGSGAFVGSHTTLNAPVTVGDGAFIGSGSVITKDVPADALGVARSQQVTREGWAKRRREAPQE